MEYTDSPMNVIQPWFIDHCIEHDMENIYLKYIKYGKDKRSNFWVVEMNDEIVGCVGAH